MRKTSTPGPDRRSPRGREESIPKPPSRKVHFDQLPLGYGRGLPAGNGIGAESGTVAIAASAFACATDAPGTSEFGISPDAPLYVPIWADAAPPMPPLCEGAGRTAGSVAIAASAFACATDAPGTSEFGISPGRPAVCAHLGRCGAVAAENCSELWGKMRRVER
jgi:hypothetical protein